MFDSPGKMLLGLFTGVIFGFLLQKGHVAKHSVIAGQLRLRDWTVARIMGTAIAVGSVGFYALLAGGMTGLDVKPAAMGGVLLGALCFGIGLAVLGYCPGTTVTAAGDGNRDAWVGIAGMAFGAAVFVAGYSAAEKVRSALVDWGKVTWASRTSSSPWWWVFALVAALVGFYAFDRWRRHRWRHAMQG
jgi:uncharacterized protein